MAVTISGVVPGSPAARKSIRPGDRLLALSSAIDWGNIGEATVTCKNMDDESRLFRLNLYGEDHVEGK